MTRRILSCVAVLAATVVPPFVGCGGSTNNGNTSADSGAEAGGGKDGSTKDSGKGGEASGGEGGGILPEGGVAPHGTQIVASPSVSLAGVTSDDYAVYVDSSGASMTLNAVALAGGAPKSIGSYDGSGSIVTGSVAVYFNGVSQSTGAGTLGVWTSAHNAQTLSTAALIGAPGGGSLDVSNDGAHVLMFDNTTATTGDVTVIDTDGTNKKVLVPAVHLDYTLCPPNIGFAGAYAIVAYCTADPSDAGAPDGGAPATATMATFTGTGWATTGSVSTAAYTGFSHDRAGAQVLYGTAAGLQVAKLAAGTSAVIDPAGLGGLFTSDGLNLVYVTTGGAIKVAAVSGTGTPTTLQASGFAGLYSLSPDDKWLTAYKQLVTDQTTGLQTSDFYLASATAAGTATALSSATTGAVYGSTFTADSSHVLWTANIDVAKGPVGDFMAAPVTGGTPAKLGSALWIDTSTTGTKVVFNDNWVGSGGGGGAGVADIKSVDTSQTAPATLLTTGADAFYYLSSAKDKVVYSWSYLPSDSRDGLWVTPLQ
jgi:hypothetical protein